MEGSADVGSRWGQARSNCEVWVLLGGGKVALSAMYAWLRRSTRSAISEGLG